MPACSSALQLEALETVQRQLTALPAELQALAAAAAQQAAALQQKGGFRLSGLAPPPGGIGGEAEGTQEAQQQVPRGGMRRAMLSAGLIPAQPRPSREERQAFAAAVVQRVAARLEGRAPHVVADSAGLLLPAAPAGPAGSSSEQAQPARLTEEEQVEQLIQQAVSQDNLSRMYEGWCPWV